MYFHNNETDTVESISDIRRSYDRFGDEYDTFQDYLSACMWWNNGALTPLEDYASSLEKQLAHLQHCAIIHDAWELYQDEIDELMAELEQLSIYRRCEQ